MRPLFCLIIVFGLIAPCFAQYGRPNTDKQFTAEVLKSTLFAKNTEEQQFCDEVIRMRDEGIIPTRIVYGVYRRAVTKELHFRFAYFKKGLEIVCKQEGIILPTVKTKLTPSISLRLFSPIIKFFQSP